MTSFAAFFESLWEKEPFPWQAMLAERGVSGDWPEAINLPTASGKTACLDAALFALAATANTPAPENRMPRRIWFVVDRRIVVDEAFERAKKIARKLARPTAEPLKEVGDRLRDLGGTDPDRPPLAVARLRGGAWRDDGWARLPSQPAIMCSTVDQVGSALLFRPYGHSDRTASIYAGLAAHDSLILLDEAHCAVPFLQTLGGVKRFRAERWAQQPLRTPFLFSVMSATPPVDIPGESTFPKPAERAVALNHPVLTQRFAARKLAALPPPVKDDEQFIAEAANAAAKFATSEGKSRVAVMVNRVATAAEIAARLRKERGGAAEVVLLTGRMRPLDRDALVEKWEPLLKAGSQETPSEPVIVVTTQCLEVGADFSFDALVTECASLDALRQRFGRLDRLGTLGETAAVILIHAEDTREPEDEDADPIYGKAIYETWKWLHDPGRRNADGAVDFGIEAMNALISAFREGDEERFKALLAPTTDAPILLPAHLDLLCQTSPRPVPGPDVSLFLHGKDRGAPDVRVLLRVDLPDPASMREAEAKAQWLDILSLIPPTSPEMLTVPRHRLRRWLTDESSNDESGDVEGSHEVPDETEHARGVFLLWRGPSRSELTSDLSLIRPNDVVVLRLTKDGFGTLGQTVSDPDGAGVGRLDLAERALRQARGRVVLRLQRDVLAPWLDSLAVKTLLEAATPEAEYEEIETALQAVLDEDAASPHPNREALTPLGLPGWLRKTIEWLIADGFAPDDYAKEGLILTGKKEHPGPQDETEDDPLADDDDLRSKDWKSVSLSQHTADVHGVASEFGARCLPPALAEVFARAAQAHDLGKLDRRFQVLLRNGAEDAVGTEPPLAKSEWLPERQRRRVEIREDVRLPTGFRHEFLSLQLTERFGFAPQDDGARDLTLHLIASHHGYARPFAPVVLDPPFEDGTQPEVSMARVGLDLTLTAGERQALPPAYRLDSGVPERFWRLTRRYGWWGLAYLEAVFRLADWQASRRPRTGVEQRPFVSPSAPPPTPSSATIALDALDGANPLGFLAALGTLRLLTLLFPARGVRLSWSLRLGAWRPILSMQREINRNEIAAALKQNGVDLAIMFSPELLAASEQAGPTKRSGEEGWKDKLRFPTPAYRRHCEKAAFVSSIVDHRLTDFAATWTGETAAHLVGKVEVARRTRFDFTAGNQALIDMFRAVRQAVSVEVIDRSLFDRWIYLQGVSLRWDPQDEKRQWALQAIDPKNNSKNPPLADAGANFLAIEALPFFPLVPDRWASQPGFDRDGDGRHWRWPIWTYPLGLDTIRSLLTLPLVDSEEWPARTLGVAAVFQSGIVQPSGRYRCFTPARSL
jgi:CRISPR-associated endonuclease/helicase Cas3